MAGNDTAGMGRDRGDPTGGNDNRNDSNDAYGGSDDWDYAENEARAYEQNERDGSSDYAGGRNPYGLDTSLAHTPVERQAFASRERQDDLAATSAISFADEAAQRGWLSTAFNHLPGLVPGNDVQAIIILIPAYVADPWLTRTRGLCTPPLSLWQPPRTIRISVPRRR